MQVKLIDVQPRVLPVTWSFLGRERLVSGDACAIYHRAGNPALRSIVTVEQYEGQSWVHVSTSTKDRIPTWEELKDVKELFMRDLLAVQLLPPPDHYLNCHPHTLHLYARLDDHAIPFELWRQR